MVQIRHIKEYISVHWYVLEEGAPPAVDEYLRIVTSTFNINSHPGEAFGPLLGRQAPVPSVCGVFDPDQMRG